MNMESEKVYLVEWVDPQTLVMRHQKIKAASRTDARDLFFEEYPQITNIERITWIPYVS
jgi:hypothetical protein